MIVKLGRITSSPSFKSSDWNAKSRATLPLETAIPCFLSNGSKLRLFINARQVTHFCKRYTWTIFFTLSVVNFFYLFYNFWVPIKILKQVVNR